MSVCLRVLTCHNLIIRMIRPRIAEEFGLTLPQFDMIAELARMERGSATFVELSRHLMVTSGNLTGIVDRLEEHGLVRREPGKSDRRVVRICLTEKGQRVSREIIPRHRQHVAELFGTMTQSDLRTLQDLLGRLRDTLHARDTARERKRRAA